MKNNFKSGLQKALDELENITPLKPFNCGKLCSARCCSGGDNDGMGLFPGEKELLENCKDFEINDSEGNFGEPVIVCRQAQKTACVQDISAVSARGRVRKRNCYSARTRPARGYVSAAPLPGENRPAFLQSRAQRRRIPPAR